MASIHCSKLVIYLSLPALVINFVIIIQSMLFIIWKIFINKFSIFFVNMLVMNEKLTSISYRHNLHHLADKI